MASKAREVPSVSKIGPSEAKNAALVYTFIVSFVAMSRREQSGAKSRAGHSARVSRLFLSAAVYEMLYLLREKMNRGVAVDLPVANRKTK